MSETAISVYLEDHLQTHVENIREWVRQPSESTVSKGVPEYAARLRDTYLEFGCREARVVDTGDDWPGVWGYYDAGAQLTIACYSFFDTYGVDETEWDFPPYGATLTSIGGFPSVVVGRGASIKGPARAWLHALEAIIATQGGLPANVLLLSEGAEMVGSPNFQTICSDAGEYLGRVDAFFSPRAAESVGTREVTVNLGYKGMVTFDLECSGKRWGRGPINGTIYGNGKSVIDSPTHRLVLALASMLGEDGNRIAIIGLEELNRERKRTSGDEEELISGLLSRYSGKPWNEVLPVTAGVATWAGDLDGSDLLREYLYGPSINISEFKTAGLSDPVKLTMLLPDRAAASVELRLVTEMPAAEILDCVRRHLSAKGFGDIEVIPYGLWDGVQVTRDSPVVQATVETLEAYGRVPVLWPIQPFGGPWAGVPSQLGVPALTGCALGYGAQGGGSPNEYFVIESDGSVAGLVESERFYADLLLRFAELASANK